VRIDAPLADELKLRQAFDERRADRGALADQHQGLGIGEAFGQAVGLLDVIVPDLDVVALELAEAGQCSERIEVIIEDRDLRGLRLV